MSTHSWTSSCGRLELELPDHIIEACHHPGDCEPDVLSHLPNIASQVYLWPDALIVEHLKGYGAWEDSELRDRKMNLQRVLWLACGDIQDELETHP